MNNLARLLRWAVVGMLALTTAGCASIVHSGYRPVTIDSNPQGASVTITDRKGRVITTETTPFTARLDPRGGYFKGQRYAAEFQLTGYATTLAPIYPKLSPWYFGNIVFGGLIGIVVVDPLTGSMWNLRPLHIEQTLEKLPEPPPVVPPPMSVPPPTPAPVAPTEIFTPPVQAPSSVPDSTNTPAQPPPAAPGNP